MALINVITIGFGLYSVKYVNIPLFLAMRRCCILATTAMNYFLRGSIPDCSLLTACSLLFLGAFTAGWESFDQNLFGFGLIWMNNFCSAFYNVMISKLNARTRLTPF